LSRRDRGTCMSRKPLACKPPVMHGGVSRIQIYWNTCTVEVAVNPCSAVGQRIDFTALLPAISTNPRILLTISTTDTTSSNRWLSLFNINNRSIFWHEVMGVVDVGKRELDGTGKLENDEYEYDVWSLRVLTIDPFCSSRMLEFQEAVRACAMRPISGFKVHSLSLLFFGVFCLYPILFCSLQYIYKDMYHSYPSVCPLKRSGTTGNHIFYLISLM